MGKEVHILPDVVKLHSRVMPIEVVVFVFGSVWVLGWYLKWALSGSSGCECGSIVCDLRASTFFRALGPWLVP